MQRQTDESLCLDGQRIHQQSRERTRGWCSARLGRLSEELGYSLDSAELGLWNSSHQCGMQRVLLGEVAAARQRSATREQGRSKTGIASLPHVRLALMSAPGPTGERQEHLDAIISFAGAGQRRRLFRGRDVLLIKWAIGDLPEGCRFLNTQLMFLKKKEKDPTSKLFDDVEWIRSLTEAQEISADVPEDSVMYDQQAVDPKKSAHSNGRLLAEIRTSHDGSLHSARVKLHLSRQQCDSSELDPRVVPRLLPSSTNSSTDEWAG